MVRQSAKPTNGSVTLASTQCDRYRSAGYLDPAALDDEGLIPVEHQEQERACVDVAQAARLLCDGSDSWTCHLYSPPLI